MPSRRLPYFRYRLKPNDRLVRADIRSPPMDGPRLRRYRREWDNEESLVTDLQRLQDKWPGVVEHPNGRWKEELIWPDRNVSRTYVDDDSDNPFLEDLPSPPD